MTTQASPPASLWDALGRPPLGLALPRARDPRWQECRRQLRHALAALGCNWTPRSPEALARAVTGGATGPGGRPLTWAELCADRAVADLPALAARLRVAREGQGADCRLASWNLRWMVDPAAPAAVAKKALVQATCMEGRVALLQETHWDPAAAAVWAGLFPGCRVLPSPARLGPGGRPQGGVAIIVPPNWTVVDWDVLVPACAVQARLRPQGAEPQGLEAGTAGTVLVQSLYFPPASRPADIGLYAAALDRTARDGPFLAAGDVNAQLHHPRGEEERRLAETLAAAWTRRGVSLAPGCGPTRRGRPRGPVGQPLRGDPAAGAAIDVVAAPREDAWAWATTPVWRDHLSDHATLRIDRTAAVAAGGGRTCSPWAFARLPPNAIQDLRLRFYTPWKRPLGFLGTTSRTAAPGRHRHRRAASVPPILPWKL